MLGTLVCDLPLNEIKCIILFVFVQFISRYLNYWKMRILLFFQQFEME